MRQMLKVLTAYSAFEDSFGSVNIAGRLGLSRGKERFRCYLAYLQRFTFSIAEQIAKKLDKRSKTSKIFRYLRLLQHVLYQHVTNKFL